MKLKKIGILQENTAFGEQATAASRATLKKLGLEPVKVEVYPMNAPDLNTYVGNLRKAGVDGVIAWIANVPNAAMAFNAMNTQKWFPPITGHNGLFLDALFDLVPPEALTNVYGTMYRTLTWTDTDDARGPPGRLRQESRAPTTRRARARACRSPTARTTISCTC